MLSRKLLLITLFTCLGMLRLMSQTTIHVHGTVTDSNGNLIPDINVLMSAIYSDSTVVFESLFTGQNGDYSTDFAGPLPGISGSVEVSMVDCFGVLSTQTFTIANGADDFQANFMYCQGIVFDSCAVYILEESNPGALNSLSAYTYTNAQVYYAWSTGDSTQTIYPTQPGTYCVEVFFPWGCVGNDCYFFTNDTTGTCFGYILSTANNDGTYHLEAYDLGTAPFTYLWSTGETTSGIDSIYPGAYCVTITDSIGCSYTPCILINNPINCYAWISGDPIGGLTAYSSGTGPFEYQWSNGEISPTIFINNFPGTYCVTVYDETGCSASACYTYTNPGDSCYVYIIPIYIDSTTIALQAISDPNSLETYLWSTGETGDTIYPNDPSLNYCVTATNSFGCVSEACFQNSQLCYSWVDIQYINPNTATLTVYADPIFGWPGSNTESYVWSTGETTEQITVHANGQYCVTSTLGAGCVSEACGYIDFDSLQYNCTTWVYQYQDTTSGQWYAAASSWGLGTFSYLWSNGDTNSVTAIDQPNSFVCVTATSTFGCVSTACTDTLFNPCQVYIYINYFNSGAVLTASSWFGGAVNSGTYLWNNGQQGPVLTVIDDGTYCVVFTSNNGCVSQACVNVNFSNADSCGVWVSVVVDSFGVLYTANPWGVAPYTYEWSNGVTTQSQITDPVVLGMCVTVTDFLGCISVGCAPYDTLDPNGANVINGYVIADSITNVYAQVLAYRFDPGTFQVTLVDSTLTDPLGFYSFPNLTPGAYLIKAIIQPGTFGYGEYLPTYHVSTVVWENAELVFLPNWLPVTTDIWMRPIGGTPPGPGIIGGVVFDPHHIVAGEGDASRGVGVPNIEVIIKNEQGDPLDFVYSASDGTFRFPDLGFGTYRISFEIPGIHSPDIWVTLTPEDPERLQISLIVNQGTTSVDQPVMKELSLYPNPATNEVNIRMPVLNATYDIRIVDMQGRTVYTGSVSSTNGILPIEVGQLSSGLFHINLKGVNQSYYSRFLKLE